MLCIQILLKNIGIYAIFFAQHGTFYEYKKRLRTSKYIIPHLFSIFISFQHWQYWHAFFSLHL